MYIVAATTLLLSVSQPWGPPAQSNGEFPPGWNGEALTPPMGWRSWNAFGNHIYQSTMMDAIDAITAKNWTVAGMGDAKVSLQDVGYSSVGVDEGWEGCGQGVNHTQHYVNGTPAVNSKFPDMKAMVDYGHKKNLKVGFYQNGCACGERVEKKINYEGDVAYLAAQGFDGVKLDGCGHQRNMTLYAQLMKATGKNYTIENCHWGDCTHSDDSSCPTTEWCPFNWYRSSGDINSGSMSWFHNLQTTIRFQSWDAPVSRPGCWAYPDMLEVGRVHGTYEWNRAHFGAWCIVSAPLVLGLELTAAKLTPIIDIITNKEAIAVNQAWAGHPGTLVWEKKIPVPSPPPPPPGPSPAPPAPLYVTAVACNSTSVRQLGWAIDGASLKQHGQCLDGSDPKQLMTKPCGGSNQGFRYSSATQEIELEGSGQQCVDIWDFNGPRVDIYRCNEGTNQKFVFNANGQLQAPKSGGGKCLQTAATPPGGDSGTGVAQLWAKPQSKDGGIAVLLINAAANAEAAFPIDFSSLNITGSFNVRDVWNRKDLGKFTTSIPAKVPASDSAFYVLTPV